MTVRILERRDLAATWTSVNPVLGSGEVGYETDTRKKKTGDGSTAWTALPYDFLTPGETAAAVAGAAAVRAFKLTRTAVKTADYTAAAGDLVPVDTTGGNVTVTLPGSPVPGAPVAVVHVVVGAGHHVTVECAGSDVIDVAGGATELTLTLLDERALLQYDAGVWTLLSGVGPLGVLDEHFVTAAGDQVIGGVKNFTGTLEVDGVPVLAGLVDGGAP